MGVQGLWPLLEPVGRRIKIEALANKTLAVGKLLHIMTCRITDRPWLSSAQSSFGNMFADASVWLFQFIKAMRDERGELLKNAHLLGFFRRICR